MLDAPQGTHSTQQPLQECKARKALKLEWRKRLSWKKQTKSWYLKGGRALNK